MHRFLALLLLVLTAWTPQALAACPMDAPGDDGGTVREHEEGLEEHGSHHGSRHDAPSPTPDHHGSHGEDGATCPVPGMCATSLLTPIQIPRGAEPPDSPRPPTLRHDGTAAPTPPLDPPPPRHPD